MWNALYYSSLRVGDLIKFKYFFSDQYSATESSVTSGHLILFLRRFSRRVVPARERQWAEARGTGGRAELRQVRQQGSHALQAGAAQTACDARAS